MIKVVEILNNMGMGGAESLIKDYATYINKEEFEITVIVGDKERGTPNEKALRELGVKTVYIGEALQQKISKWNLLGKSLRKWKRNKLFYQALEQEKPDVIHGHQHVNQYIYAYIRKNPGTAKLFYTVHSLPEHIFRREAEKKITQKLIDEHELHLIALQDQAARELKKLFKTDLVLVVNNCINVERFQSAAKDRKTYGIPEDAIVVGNVGRMNWVKNQTFLIDIFEEYRKKQPKAFLLIIGNGDKKLELLDKISQKGLEQCSLVLSDRGDIPELMKTMDYFVFPSLHEGFGLVVIEAQACGLKCVISDRVPDDTYVSDQVSVVSVEEGADTWVKAIEKNEFKVAQKYPIENYDIRNVVNALEELYRGSL